MGIKRIFATGIAALVFTFSATTADAAKAKARLNDSLEFVTQTGLSGLSLCHVVETFTIQGIPLTSESKGYALAANQCDTDNFMPIEAEEIAAAQADGLIPADVPLVPSLSTFQRVKNIVIIGGGIIFALGAIALNLGYFRRSKKNVERSTILNQGLTGLFKSKGHRVSQKNATQILAAMCFVAKSDGDISNTETVQIMNLMKAYTGKSVTAQMVMTMLAETSQNVDDDELRALAHKRSPKDCEIILEAALAIAAADGQLHTSEYMLVSRIATALNIGRIQFETALARVAGNLQQQVA